MDGPTSPPGSYPAMPPEPGRPTGPLTPPPAPVENAVRLMFVRAALGVLGLLALLLTRESLRTTLLEQNSTLSAGQVDTAVSVALGVGLVLGAIFAVLYVLLALQVRKGRSWARIVTIIIAALSLLAGLANLTQPAPGVTRVLGLLTVLIEVGILYLLLTRPAADYFRSRP